MLRGFSRAVLACAIFAGVAASPASAANWNVNTTADDTDPNIDGVCFAPAAGGLCSLRAAIQEANGNPGPDNVLLPPGRYELTVTGAAENGAQLGDLDLTGNTGVIGQDARTTIVDANGIDRVFHVPSGVGNAIQGVTITGGSADMGGGGGVLNTGELTIADSAIVANAGFGFTGGGINNNATSGSLTVRRSLIADHATSGQGAGISNNSNLAIENSTLSDNHTSGNGGALFSTGSTNTVSINQTTFFDNTGGGSSAGIHVAGPSPVSVRNSIVAGSNQCLGPISSAGYNLVQAGGCPFSQPGDMLGDPQLGALGNNGGPTDTHMIAPTSPARDAANPANCVPTDQRGFARPFGPRCDIGAVEWYAPVSRVALPAALTLDPAQADRTPGDPNVVTATARNDDGTPAAGRTIRYAIAGPNDGAGTATTDSAGVARITWEGVREGTDTLTAYVDTNGDATQGAPEPTASAQVKWALPVPRQGRTMNIEPVSGVVRITEPASSARRKGATTSVLTEAKQVPIGTRVDVRRGRVQMGTVARRGTNEIQKGEFYGGTYQTVQSTRSARPYTELRLNEGLICQPNSRGKLAPARARSRRLWGNGRGRFRTRGRHSVATVRGTVWLQKDTCTKTTTVVRQGVVIVRDLAKRKNVRVRSGRRYVARQRTRR